MKTFNEIKEQKLYFGDKFDIITTDGRKLRLVIEQDENPDDPRSWDNMGTMLCYHPRYDLGDYNNRKEMESKLDEICRKYGEEEPEEKTLYEKMRFLLEQENICGLPLWLYDHGGISMSTERVDRFDSSLVGIIFVEKETFFAQTCKKDDCDWKKEAEEMLREEIRIYSDYLEGDVYFWVLYESVIVTKHNMKGEELSKFTVEEGEVVDSMGGFYNPTFGDVADYFDFEIASAEEV